MSGTVFLFLDSLGGGEVLIIVLVMIMFFGSDKLPGIIKTLGKGMREINEMKAQVQHEIQKNTGNLQAEIKKHASDLQSEIEKAEAVFKPLAESGQPCAAAFAPAPVAGGG